MPDSQRALPVRASLLAIPDSFEGDALRLSLQITPSLEPVILTSGAPEIALASWPSDIVGALRQLSVYVAPIDTKGRVDMTGIKMLGLSGSFRPLKWTGAPAAGAQQLWAATFPAGIDSLWRELSRMASPDPAADVPLLSPTIDSRRLAETLIASQVKSAQARINGLATTKRGRASAPAEPFAETMREAWAIPGTIDGDQNVVAPDLATKRQAEVTAAIARALEGSTGALPVWAGFTSYAMLEAYANGEMLKGPLERQLAQALREARPTTEAEMLSSRLKSLALTVPAVGPDPQPPGPVPVEPGEVERRKLGAILTFPTIAQYLGMIADIAISRAQWADAVAAGVGERGAIAVTFGDLRPDAATNWTAYWRSPAGRNGPPVYFGPAERSEAIGALDENRKIARGLLNLGATRLDHGTTTQRYSLSVVDVVNSANRQIAQARRSPDQATVDTSSNRPDLRGRGIALIDSGMQEDEAATRAAADALAARLDRLHFAEDLLIGYRPVVGIAAHGVTDMAVAPGRWRSLVARHVDFDSAIGAGFVRDYYNNEREYGHTRSPLGIQRGADSNGNPIDVVLNHPEMFVWTGDSLAVPSTAEEAGAAVVQVDAATDLPVGITYSLPKQARASGLMPLRDGRRYVFGASAMFVNGCGPSVDATIAALVANPHFALGKDGEAFTFTRCDPLPPPVVLLPVDHRLVTQTDLRDLPGETLTTLVIRRGGDQVDRRFLFPEHIAFERAEQQDMFRDDHRPKPRGAFGSAAGIGARRHPKTGEFPGARNRRGPILQIEAAADGSTAQEYYPDGYTRGVWAHIDAVHPKREAATDMAAAAPFRSGAKAISAKPVMLEIVANGSTRFESEPRFQFATDRWHELPELGVRIPKIAIKMAPASMATITLTPDFDPDEVLDKHLIARSLANGAPTNGKTSGREALRAALVKALPRGRISELQGATTLTIVHAVPQPLHPPQFEPDFRPVVLSVRSASDPDGKGPLRRWPEIVSANKHLPLVKWSEPDGTTCFFVGALKIDAPSTGVVGCDGEWQEWGPEVVRFNPKANAWELYAPQQFARLFTLSSISSEVDAGDVVLHDLAVAPEGMAYSFRDGRARCLDLTLVARSRFAEYYSTIRPDPTLCNETTKHECMSPPISRWVPCNFRPAQPNVDRVTPLLDLTTAVDTRRQTFTFTRTTGLRVELGDGCYGSGQGEQLALIFNAQSSTGVCDYGQEPMRPFASGVTRWGRDPLYEGRLAQINLLPENFSGFQQQHSGLRLPAAQDAESEGASPKSFIDVEALAFDLKFDTRVGRFYVDIATHGAADVFADTYMPFVQLGLARLQMHAVEGSELSSPVGEMVQVLPRRSGQVHFPKARDGQRFDFWLDAPRSSSTTGKQQWVLEVTALRKDPSQPDGWAPQLAAHGGANPVRQVRTRADAAGRDLHTWHIDAFRMEKSRLTDHLGVQIEEFEESPQADGSIVRRLLFGHIVDLGSPS